MTRWSAEDVDRLLARDGLYDIEVIAHELNRTRRACEQKLARIKGTAHKQYERDQVSNTTSRETARGKRILVPAYARAEDAEMSR